MWNVFPACLGGRVKYGKWLPPRRRVFFLHARFNLHFFTPSLSTVRLGLSCMAFLFRVNRLDSVALIGSRTCDDSFDRMNYSMSFTNRFLLIVTISCLLRWWLVWLSGNGVRHINEGKLRRARLVLGLVTTFGGSAIPTFIQAHSAWPSFCG